MTILSLRKARKLETKIDQFEFPKTDVDIRVSLEDDEVKELLEANRLDFRKFFATAKQLLAVKYEIRQSIGEANAEHGINELITKRQSIKQRLGLVGTFISRANVTSDEVVVDTIHNERDSEGSRFGGARRASVEVSYFTEDLLKELKDERVNLKASLDEVEEDILVLNNTKHIELSDESVALLKNEQLL